MGRDNYNEVCRLCGNSGEPVVDLFDKNISKIDLVSVIIDTLHLTVKETDCLPKKICVTCKKIVEEFERFRQSCILTEKTFQVSSYNDSTNNKTEGMLGLKSNAVFTEEYLQDVNIDEENELLKNVKVEVVDGDEQVDGCDGMFFSADETDFDEAVIKKPNKDDYILVKQDIFTLDETTRRTPNNYVEYCKPGIIPSDRLLVENVKKRQALPEMWDVYELETQENMTKVTMRRYIISKGAFSCSLCSKCIAVKSDVQQEENWDVNCEYQGHTEGVIEEMFEEGNFVEKKGPENGKVCSVIPSCDICKKTFNRTQSLKRHYRTHFGYDRLPCEICGKGFSRKEHLSRHMILHSRGRPFECVKCKKGFTRKEHLTRHMLLHKERGCSNVSVKMANCNIDLGSSQKKRKSTYTCRPKPFSCGFCDAGFGQKGHLIKHLRRMHNRSYNGSSTLHVSGGTIEEFISESKDEVKESDGQHVSSPLLAPNSSSFHLPTSTSTPSSSPLSASSLPLTSSLSSVTMRTRSEKTLFLCQLCPRSFSRSEQLGRHLKVHRRDSMFVNESRIPETDPNNLLC